MKEENKKVELTKEQLDQVAGGAEGGEAAGRPADPADLG